MTRSLFIFIAAVGLSWAGCAGSGAIPGSNDRLGRGKAPTSQPPLNGAHPAGTPQTDLEQYARRLSEADARRIADELVRTNTGFGGYSCKHVFFEEMSTPAGLAGRWVVTYGPESEAPDFEVFIEVDDATGNAKAYRW